MSNKALQLIDKVGMIFVGILIVCLGMLGFTYYDLKKTEEEIVRLKADKNRELDRVLDTMIKRMEDRHNDRVD